MHGRMAAQECVARSVGRVDHACHCCTLTLTFHPKISGLSAALAEDDGQLIAAWYPGMCRPNLCRHMAEGCTIEALSLKGWVHLEGPTGRLNCTNPIETALTAGLFSARHPGRALRPMTPLQAPQ
jgi:hypothetical protein